VPVETDTKETTEFADTKTVKENIIAATKGIKDIFDQKG
jgi:hypothetical protein